MKTCIQYSTMSLLAVYKYVCNNSIWYGCLFLQIFVDFVGFLSMIIYEVLHT